MNLCLGNQLQNDLSAIKKTPGAEPPPATTDVFVLGGEGGDILGGEGGDEIGAQGP